MSERIAVVLSGCGFLDGAEIHESIATLLAIDRARAQAFCFAPNIDQMHVVNHLAGKPTDESRNVLMEAARITRGKIRDLKEAKISEFDALVFPGGYGAAKNLCNFATAGATFTVLPELQELIRAVYEAKKPIGVACIAPVVVAKALEGKQLELSIGCDKDVAAVIEKLGHKHINLQVRQAHVDKTNRVVSTPAYMYDNARISEVVDGIDSMIHAILELC